jgi:hypothetical protein
VALKRTDRTNRGATLRSPWRDPRPPISIKQMIGAGLAAREGIIAGLYRSTFLEADGTRSKPQCF